MKIDQETLNKLASSCGRVNGHLLKVVVSLPSGDLGKSDAVVRQVWDAQLANNLLMQRLLTLGADDLAQTDTTALRASLEDVPASDGLPLALLGSPAAMRYARALRATYEACKEMEEERGIEDGLTEMFEVYAQSAEMEVFGPVGTSLE